MSTTQQSSIPLCDPVACVAAGCDPIVCKGAGVPSNVTLFERSARVIPGGVNSSIRAFKAVGGSPYVVARGSGAHVYDVEERVTLTSFKVMVRSFLATRIQRLLRPCVKPP